MLPEHDDCQLLTVRELSALLRLSHRTIWREAAKGEAGLSPFPTPLTVAGGRLKRWRLSEVQAYLAGLVAEKLRS